MNEKYTKQLEKRLDEMQSELSKALTRRDTRDGIHNMHKDLRISTLESKLKKYIDKYGELP